MNTQDISSKSETIVSDLEGYNAVLYARVSTDDKEQTCETQIRNMKAWCKQKGVNIVGIYQDEQTGKTLMRENFLAMMGRILVGGDIQILLVNEQSRLTRDMKLEEIKEKSSYSINAIQEDREIRGQIKIKGEIKMMGKYFRRSGRTHR